MEITNEELLELYSIIVGRNELSDARNSIRFKKLRLNNIYEAIVDNRSTISVHGDGDKVPKKYKEMPRRKLKQSILKLDVEYAQALLEISHFTEQTSKRLREIKIKYGIRVLGNENKISTINLNGEWICRRVIATERQRLVDDKIFEDEILNVKI